MLTLTLTLTLTLAAHAATRDPDRIWVVPMRFSCGMGVRGPLQGVWDRPRRLRGARLSTPMRRLGLDRDARCPMRRAQGRADHDERASPCGPQDSSRHIGSRPPREGVAAGDGERAGAT